MNDPTRPDTPDARIDAQAGSPPRPPEPGAPATQTSTGADPAGTNAAAPPVPNAAPRTGLARRVGQASAAVMGLGAWIAANTLTASLTLAVLALIGLAALPLSEPGSRWLLAHVPGLQVEQPRGALLGEFSAASVSYRWGRRELRLSGLSWQGVDLAMPGSGQPDWTIRVSRLGAASLSLHGPGDDGPLHLPADLVLPVAVRIERVTLARIELDALAGRPVQALDFGLALGAGQGGEHRITALSAQWDRLHAQGQVRLGAAAPLPLSAELALLPLPAGGAAAAPPGSADELIAQGWQARLSAQGLLADFVVDASVRARGQSLDARAGVRPADPLPLRQLRARLAGLDLAAFSSALPYTALSGEIQAALGTAQPAGSPAGTPAGASAPVPAPAPAAATAGTARPGQADSLPLQLSADLRNDRPARIDQGGVPLRRLRLQAHSDAHAPQRGEVQQLQLDFAGNDAAAPAAPPPASAAAATRTPAARTPQRLTYAAIDAGRLSGRGSWQIVPAAGPGSARRLVLQTDASVDALQPALLDQRAPGLGVSGPFSLGYEQLLDARPAPAAGPSHDNWPRLSIATDVSGRMNRRQTRSAAGAADPGTAPAAGAAAATRAGSGEDYPPVRLRLKAVASPHELLVEQLDAQSGAARLRASGSARRQPASWQIALQGALDDFDPGLWWPGLADSPWRRGPHRLAGELQAELDLPDPRADARPGADALLTRLAGLAGSTQLHLRSSLLAGVPVAGTLQLSSAGQRGPGTALAAGAGQADPARVQVAAEISVGDRAIADSALAGGGLGLSLRGQLDPLGSDDTWQLAWQGRELDALTPWLRLAGSAWALHGDTRGNAELTGRWPLLRGSGELQAEQLQLVSRPAVASDPAGVAPARPMTLGLDGLSAQWSAGSRLDDPARLTLNLAGLRGAGLDLRELQLAAQGSGAQHQLRLRSLWLRGNGTGNGSSAGTGSATSPGGAGPAADSEPGLPRRWQLTAQAQGGWADLHAGLSAAAAAAEPGRYRWQGRIEQLTLEEAAGARPATAEPASLWSARLAPATLSLDLGGTRSSLRLGATRLQFADAALALDELSWHQRDGDELADLDLRARLEPYAVAPLLARIQPGFGWRGNLRIGGQLELHAHHRDGIRASAELSRSSGDLEVVDPDNPGGPQRLGLAELRLALQGRDGAWALTQRIDGSNLGRLDGSQRVTARSAQAWPGRSDKVEGLLDLQVAQLGNWGRWLPAGWRLAGQLQTQARIGGRLGAPEFSGELVGRQIAVRNSLQGVNWTDARLRVVLEGEQARVDEFTVKAGAGTLTATGQARLGAAPRIDVALKADHFAAMQRIDRRVVVSGTAELSADAGTTRLKGRLRADEGRIDVSQGDAPGLADDVVVLRPEADAAAAATARERGAAPRGRRGLVLDLGADLGDNFELRGRGITTQLTGVLLVTSPNDKVALNGTITAVDGSYAAYGQKLAIDRGLITFTGPAENPRLDIQATRPDLDDVKVGVAITGTAQNPRVRLFSEPEMSNTDKLSWLLLGRASDGLGSTDLSLLQRAAFSLLAGESDSPSLVQRIGLDQFGVRQTEGTVRETIVTLGKQLSRRWYVGYERSLNAATGSWQLIYRLAQRFTLRAQSGLDNAVDLIWTWKWDNSRDSPPPADAARPQR